MKKDAMYLIMKIVTAVFAAINAAYFSFVLWLYLAVKDGSILSVASLMPVSITALVLDALYGAFIVLYLAFRKK